MDNGALYTINQWGGGDNGKHTTSVVLFLAVSNFMAWQHAAFALSPHGEINS